ncbi:SAF domain-containing protein [[Clostridium] innocuum]|uniref:SAF domain-containing protein n=1 Tax=Clostridium innocuum TaxID=1522 RepID=UPI000D6B8E49|nr:SAF domain-containing protein [[Clostridium] innocuum]MCR0316878.1 SAF domain-containing protein [[Clostridium] innocuum]MCR0369680.1 SAF domain-containing protein [[Clostridium] innocuum]MCR0374808.1 SAF domain-containing protein [[Clostridium] innocuum]MCR0559633.1 SAF domain-containing protein [[Clostridium] innocuum]MCR0602673.1 SAF domain-containing protein [[Clostridium] innocuum]
MDNKRYKNFMRLIIALLVLSLGLFIFQNFGLKLIEEKQMTQYYVATKDIPVFTKLDPSLFKAVQTETSSIAPGAITNLNEVSNSYAKQQIYKDDLLTQSKVTTKNDEEGYVYTMEITADYSGPLEFGEYVDIYTLSKDNVPALLFSHKKLYAAPTKQLDSADGNGTQEQTTDKRYVKVTKQEMLDYYSKLKTYSFIVLPIEVAYTDQNVANAGTVTTGQATPENDDLNKKETFTWEVKKGETFESIAKDWNMKEEDLKALNPDVTELKEGTKIKILVADDNKDEDSKNDSGSTENKGGNQ